ncbi:unnamed protein product [Camellia sinensis]
MGSSLACLCPHFTNHQSTEREVLVMKQDGKLIRFANGIPVKHVLATYPNHKVILCRSDHRLVLSDSHRLSSNRLYFLLLEGLAECDATYESLVRAAASKGMVISKEVDKGVVDQKMSIDDFGCKNSPWRPTLQTIPEAPSPPLHANV